MSQIVVLTLAASGKPHKKKSFQVKKNDVSNLNLLMLCNFSVVPKPPGFEWKLQALKIYLDTQNLQSGLQRLLSKANVLKSCAEPDTKIIAVLTV